LRSPLEWLARWARPATRQACKREKPKRRKGHRRARCLRAEDVHGEPSGTGVPNQTVGTEEALRVWSVADITRCVLKGRDRPVEKLAVIDRRAVAARARHALSVVAIESGTTTHVRRTVAAVLSRIRNPISTHPDWPPGREENREIRRANDPVTVEISKRFEGVPECQQDRKVCGVDDAIRKKIRAYDPACIEEIVPIRIGIRRDHFGDVWNAIAIAIREATRCDVAAVRNEVEIHVGRSAEHHLACVELPIPVAITTLVRADVAAIQHPIQIAVSRPILEIAAVRLAVAVAVELRKSLQLA
jgi:hypothetical protein